MSMSNQVIPSNITSLNEMQIETNTYNVLKETLYPGAKDASIAMVLSYCKARKIDPLLKPVHLVPMNVKSGKKDSGGKDMYEWRDVVMPGIGLYRIDASRSGQYAGMSEPEFGEDITEVLGSSKVTYPKWCKVTVKKLLGDHIVEFSAKEYWKENYATKSRSDATPNAMWEKRSYGQLAKCAEAQALRKAFPDVVGQDYTKEEMEGKHFPEAPKSAKPVNNVIEGTLMEPEEIHTIEKDLMDISWAADVDALQDCYKKAYKYWAQAKNKENIAKVMAAKDERKAQLELDESKIDLETGEVLS